MDKCPGDSPVDYIIPSIQREFLEQEMGEGRKEREEGDNSQTTASRKYYTFSLS